MQLKRKQSSLWPLSLLLSALVVAAPAMAGSDVEAPDRPSTDHADTQKKPSSKSPSDPNPLADTATESAAVEMAAYDDTDHVTVFTPSIALGVENVNGGSLHANYLVDVVSAASVDIVSTASRRWQEVRHAGSLSGAYKPHDFGVEVGGSVSNEPDYLSWGGHALLTKDFDEKNWSLYLGYGFSRDTIGRCGGLNDGCTPFSVFSRDLLRNSIEGGADFVIDHASLGSISADVVLESGDQSKPYRYVPMFSPEVAPTVAKGASVDWVNQNRNVERPLEQLPLSRRRYAITGRYARRIGTTTLRLEERLYDDSWGLAASSTDMRWVIELGRRFALWPHARFHVQNSVVFWKRAYVSGLGWDLPEYRTGDRELGPLWTVQGGLGVKWYVGHRENPEAWAFTVAGDEMYTAFPDDLYVKQRGAVLGSLGFEGQF
jgi:hypothetical protein